MVTLLVIGGIILATFLLVQLNKLISRSINGADRVLRRKTWQQSQLDGSAAFLIECPVSSEKVITSIVANVNPYENAPAIVEGTYLKQKTKSVALFGWGSKFNGDRFVAKVGLIESSDGQSCRGEFTVEQWQAMGAEFVGRDALHQLVLRVQQAVQDAGGNIQEISGGSSLQTKVTEDPVMNDVALDNSFAENHVDPTSQIEPGIEVASIRICEDCGAEFTPLYRRTICLDCGGALKP